MKADTQRGRDEVKPQTTLWAVIQKLKCFIFYSVTRQSDNKPLLIYDKSKADY